MCSSFPSGLALDTPERGGHPRRARSGHSLFCRVHPPGCAEGLGGARGRARVVVEWFGGGGSFLLASAREGARVDWLMSRAKTMSTPCRFTVRLLSNGQEIERVYQAPDDR